MGIAPLAIDPHAIDPLAIDHMASRETTRRHDEANRRELDTLPVGHRSCENRDPMTQPISGNLPPPIDAIDGRSGSQGPDAQG